jgi:hypothetical protein
VRRLQIIVRRHAVAVLCTSIALALALSACGGSTNPSQSGSSPPSTGTRPSSPAVVKILEPKANAKLTGTSVHVVVSLENAKIVSTTTTNIRPDEGHLHLYVNNVLTSMNYALDQTLPVHAGTYALKVEFVASDHAPFNPRVVSPVVVFVVH